MLSSHFLLTPLRPIKLYISTSSFKYRNLNKKESTLFGIIILNSLRKPSLFSSHAIPLKSNSIPICYHRVPPRDLALVPAYFVPLATLLNLLNNLSTKNAFPYIGIPSIIAELFEDHGSATAVTNHRNLLHRFGLVI